MWGYVVGGIGVVPTCVGVNRLNIFSKLLSCSGPHVCGGEPLLPHCQIRNPKWSPRVWG